MFRCSPNGRIRPCRKSRLIPGLRSSRSRTIPRIDDPAIEAALRAGCFYIGALGSKKTHAKRLERLSAEGFSVEQLARIHAPIGLSIGATTPGEIAVAILGEITLRRRCGPEARP